MSVISPTFQLTPNIKILYIVTPWPLASIIRNWNNYLFRLFTATASNRAYEIVEMLQKQHAI